MMLNNIDWNKLKVFSEVMISGGVTSASKELNLTRSAVSQSISTLESQMGVNLFYRKSRKLLPTSKAKLLFKELNKYQKGLNQALHQCVEKESQVEGVIKIGAYLEFAKIYLTPIVSSFLKEYPDVQIKFQFDSPSQLQTQLEKNKLDMVFSIYPIKGIKEIEAKKILEEDLVLIVPNVYMNITKNYSSFLGIPIVDYYSNHIAIKRWVFHHYKKKPKKLNVKLWASTAEMVLQMVNQGVGMGVVPHYLLENVNSQKFQILNIKPNPLKDYIWLNQYKGQFSSSAHRAFNDFIEEI